jgi:UDP-N-acetyl-2-amino-2-deoxyglucuronate dehydrogenase
MATANEPTRVAVTGLGPAGRLMLRALRAMDDVCVVAVADENVKLANEVARDIGCEAYGDNRSLLIYQKPTILFADLPPMSGPDVVAACAERGVHLWKQAPLARNLPEGLEMVRTADEAGIRLAVGTERRFAPGFEKTRDLLGEVGPVFLVRGHYFFNWGPELKWRSDRASAGGGALLELGYHLIDLVTWLVDAPLEAFGLQAVQHSNDFNNDQADHRPVHDTDDTASAILNFGQGVMASLVTTRVSGPFREMLALHGRSGSLTASSENCTLRDIDGRVLDQTAETVAPVEMYRRQGRAFVDAVSRDTTLYPASGWENLLNLAVLDALYLSNQTGQPESPIDMLTSLGLNVDLCRAHRPG